MERPTYSSKGTVETPVVDRLDTSLRNLPQFLNRRNLLDNDMLKFVDADDDRVLIPLLALPVTAFKLTPLSSLLKK